MVMAKDVVPPTSEGDAVPQDSVPQDAVPTLWLKTIFFYGSIDIGDGVVLSPDTATEVTRAHAQAAFDHFGSDKFVIEMKEN